MSTSPDFELPPSVSSSDWRGLHLRETQREPTPPPIPSHYATSFSQLKRERAQQSTNQPTQQPTQQLTQQPTQQPTQLSIDPRGYDVQGSEYETLSTLLSNIERVLRDLAVMYDAPILESFALRLSTIKLNTEKPTKPMKPTKPTKLTRSISDEVYDYVALRRAQSAKYDVIASELNERMLTQPELAPPISKAWNAGSLRRLVHRNK